jgi:hypothetical protein
MNKLLLNVLDSAIDLIVEKLLDQAEDNTDIVHRLRAIQIDVHTALK